MRSLVASLHDTLGDYDQGWRVWEQALETLRADVAPRWLHAILGAATRSARRDGFLHAALWFAETRLQSAQREGAPIRVAEAATEQARVELENGLRDRAGHTLAIARAAADRIDAAAVRARIHAARALAEAQLSTDPSEALSRSSNALAGYASTGAELQLGRLFLQRARVLVTLGDAAAAERDLRQGIRVFEQARRQLADASTRISYFDEAWHLFDELLELKVQQRQFDSALDILEQGRGRALRELTRTSSTPRTLAATLPDGIAVLCYAVLDREIVIWLFHRKAIKVVPVSVDRLELQRLVAASRDEARTDRHEADSGLYNLLVAPIESFLSHGERLYIVPDPLLHHVSFAALWRPATRQYLIEGHTIVLLPSLAAVQVVSRHEWTPATRALIIAAPEAGAGEGLPRLPAVAREAGDIATLYEQPLLFAPEALRRRRVMESLSRYQVVHFAGHALVNMEAPDLSRLLLSADPDEGRLYARDLASLDLRRVKVVTLAACQTAGGRTSRNEGVLSLARSFVSRGVSRVVGTLWEIDDASAGRMFTAVHRLMRAGQSPEEAVADVQRTMIRGGQPRAAWTAVVVVGRTIN